MYKALTRLHALQFKRHAWLQTICSSNAHRPNNHRSCTYLLPPPAPAGRPEDLLQLPVPARDIFSCPFACWLPTMQRHHKRASHGGITSQLRGAADACVQSHGTNLLKIGSCAKTLRHHVSSLQIRQKAVMAVWS